MSRAFTIVPVKPLGEGKLRLAAILSSAERERLNRLLLRRTLDRAVRFPGAARTIVVSASDDVLDEARRRGMIAIREAEGAGLNAALALAVQAALAEGATGVLIQPVDLPFATAEALRALIAGAPPAPGCAIVPDRHGKGTNLLYQSPPLLRRFDFGDDSFRLHSAAAAECGLKVVVSRDPALCFDIDEPADYKQWRASESANIIEEEVPSCARS